MNWLQIEGDWDLTEAMTTADLPKKTIWKRSLYYIATLLLCVTSFSSLLYACSKRIP